jgi:hypothetical protein
MHIKYFAGQVDYSYLRASTPAQDQSLNVREPTILGVELALENPEDRRTTYPNLILRINRTYYVVEAKHEMKNEPRAKKTGMRH